LRVAVQKRADLGRQWVFASRSRMGLDASSLAARHFFFARGSAIAITAAKLLPIARGVGKNACAGRSNRAAPRAKVGKFCLLLLDGYWLRCQRAGMVEDRGSVRRAHRRRDHRDGAA
jgi:hypothetical protein